VATGGLRSGGGRLQRLLLLLGRQRLVLRLELLQPGLHRFQLLPHGLELLPQRAHLLLEPLLRIARDRIGGSRAEGREQH
jgi:hypothetical protein